MYDGIHVKQELVWDAYTQKFDGFVDFGHMDETALFKATADATQADPAWADCLATEYVQFYFRSVGANFKTPVAGWCVNSPTSVNTDTMVDLCLEVRS